MLVRITLATVLSAPALLLTACGGGSSSVTDPPVSSVTSATPNPPKRETPEHFIRRFYVAEQAMENSGATGPYLAMVHGCEPCSDLAQRVRTIYREGGYVHWNGLTILSMTRTSMRQGHATFRVRLNAQPTHYKLSANAVEQSIPGGRSIELLGLRASDHGWRVDARARTTT